MPTYQQPTPTPAATESPCPTCTAHRDCMTTPTTEKLAATSPWLNIDDLSEYVRSPKGTIYRWRYLGEGPPARGKAGRRPLYHRDDVDAWLIGQAAA